MQSTRKKLPRSNGDSMSRSNSIRGGSSRSSTRRRSSRKRQDTHHKDVLLRLVKRSGTSCTRYTIIFSLVLVVALLLMMHARSLLRQYVPTYDTAGGGGVTVMHSMLPSSVSSLFVSKEEDEENPKQEQEQAQLCTREQIRHYGYWKQVERIQGAPYKSQEKWESTCYQPGGVRQGDIDSSPFVDYEWHILHRNQSHSSSTATSDDEAKEKRRETETLEVEPTRTTTMRCTFGASFDRDRFCTLSRNRTLAFLGDSITWQQFQSLNFLLNATDIVRRQALIQTRACSSNSSSSTNSTHTHTHTNLVWIRDNYASQHGMERMINTYHPNIIVFNRGAHYVEDTALLEGVNQTLARVSKWQQECDHKHMNNNNTTKDTTTNDCVLIWRTTAPGFPNCPVHRHEGPIAPTNKSYAETIINDRDWYTQQNKKDFHWDSFYHQNVLVEELMTQQYNMNNPNTTTTHQLRIAFLDFYELAILRPDHHINNDCLHYCLPGPIDASNVLLLHELERNNKR